VTILPREPTGATPAAKPHLIAARKLLEIIAPADFLTVTLNAEWLTQRWEG